MENVEPSEGLPSLQNMDILLLEKVVSDNRTTSPSLHCAFSNSRKKMPPESREIYNTVQIVAIVYVTVPLCMAQWTADNHVIIPCSISLPVQNILITLMIYIAWNFCNNVCSSRIAYLFHV